MGSEYAQKERLSNLIRSELRDNVVEEEERRAAAKARAAARRVEAADEDEADGVEIYREKETSVITSSSHA